MWFSECGGVKDLLAERYVCNGTLLEELLVETK